MGAPEPTTRHDPDCRRCARLADFLDAVRAEHPDYFCRPVPAFGDARSELLVVGLAPGMHGANRSGRPFTGDYAGILLYATLHKFGFASHAGSADPEDGLVLDRCRVTNAVKCLPPENRPLPAEVRACNGYLSAEIAALAPRAILALGTVAHAAVLTACGLRASSAKFAHGAAHDLPGGSRLFDSYHCSRYNTNTGRLTGVMFESVFRDIQRFLT